MILVRSGSWRITVACGAFPFWLVFSVGESADARNAVVCFVSFRKPVESTTACFPWRFHENLNCSWVRPSLNGVCSNLWKEG